MNTMFEAPELSIVIPTFNEKSNITVLVNRLRQCLEGVRWEVIFVDDDSPDGTAQIVRDLGLLDSRVRLLHRVHRRGLSSACIEGMLASISPFVAVMDADLQHDEILLPQMLSTLKSESLDIVIGSRYIEGGSIGKWASDREFGSRLATRLSSLVLKADLKDPMSGFFMLRRELIENVVHDLSAIGFKILLDIFVTAKQPLRFRELPYHFKARTSGESKLDNVVAWQYIAMLLDKSIGRYVPIRFIAFASIGGLGVFVHMAVLWAVFRGIGESFVVGQIAATLLAMTFNFFLNNWFTYSDRRLRGWGLLRGLISFSIACSLGAVANVGIATYLFNAASAESSWWVLSAIAGIIVGAVWNYAVTSVYTWSQPKSEGIGR